MRTPLTTIARVLAALWRRLDNEPIVRWLGSIIALLVVVRLLGVTHVIPGDVAATLTGLLTAALVAAVKHVRSQVVGPVTASQMVQLPGTDPTKAGD